MRLKKIKGAEDEIKKSQYYVNNPTEYKGKWKDIFNNNNPIHIEIGMGKGKFIIQMAKINKNINYIGIEMYDSVLVKATKHLEDEEYLENLKLLLFDANNINEIFDKEISRIYLNFSDPWPKTRHAKRRLTSENFLNKYDFIFKDKNEIFMKTDNNDLFEFSMESFEKHGYTLKNITRDLKDENNVLTEYESKFISKGIKINRLEAYK